MADGIGGRGKVVAAAVVRDSLGAPPRAAAQPVGDLEPDEERGFELQPGGNVVDLVFVRLTEGNPNPVPLPTRRQISSMMRVLQSRPRLDSDTEECLEPAPGAARVDEDAGPNPEGEPGAVLTYDQPPRPLRMTKPQYDTHAFDGGVEGTVVVEIRISRTGHVDCARVLRSLPGTGLDAEALKTVYQWRFEPAVKGGRTVPTIAHAPVTFRIY